MHGGILIFVLRPIKYELLSTETIVALLEQNKKKGSWNLQAVGSSAASINKK
jgi:stress response protein SCP2